MASWIDISRTPASEKDALLDQLRAQRVVLHLIQETARHAGHADIIRESLDGTTGI